MRYILVVLFASCFVGCADNNSGGSSVNTNSFEYNYSKNRLRSEGFSDKDSDTAARAIMKFNEAQRNRR